MERRLLCVQQEAVSSISLEQQQRTRAYQSMFWFLEWKEQKSGMIWLMNNVSEV